MIRRPPRSTRTDTLFPTRRSSDLLIPFSETRNYIQRVLEGVQVYRALLSNQPPTMERLYADMRGWSPQQQARSEEHTSELQSLMRISYAVFCLKKNNKKQQIQYKNIIPQDYHDIPTVTLQT